MALGTILTVSERADEGSAASAPAILNEPPINGQSASMEHGRPTGNMNTENLVSSDPVTGAGCPLG